MLIENYQNKHNTIHKLRSYSSVFSSTSFLKLLKYDDYSFIDEKIEAFDKSRIGKGIYTYYDYIQYIYSKLARNYQNEYVYKNTFVNKLLIEQYGVEDTVAINEFRVGNSIADIVLFNGTSKAFEIKTELDSNKRLEGQIADYTKLFKKCYVITHTSLVDKYLLENDSIGVIELIERPRSLTMREVRAAKENELIDAETLIKAIRTSEYKNIVKQHFGELPEMNSFTMFDSCRELLKQIPNEQLNHLFIEELKKRKTNIGFIQTYHKELRHLCLAMHIDPKLYQSLNAKLSKPINPN